MSKIKRLKNIFMSHNTAEPGGRGLELKIYRVKFLKIHKMSFFLLFGPPLDKICSAAPADLGYQRRYPPFFLIFYENFAISDNFWMWNASNNGKFKESFKKCVEYEEKLYYTLAPNNGRLLQLFVLLRNSIWVGRVLRIL